MLGLKAIQELQAQMASLALPERLVLQVPRDRLALAVRLGLLEPKAIPASLVQQVLLVWPDSKVSKVPLAQRARQGLRELQVLPV